MKKKICSRLLVVLFLLGLTFIATAQSVGIGTTTPDGSAVLDVTSTNKGFLLPRLTYSQRTAIGSPAMGLLVYQTNTSTSPAGFYVYTAAGWKEIAKAEDLVAGNSWTVSGNNQYSGVSGFVGIGTTAPTQKLHISNGQLRLSRTASFENNIVFNMPLSTGDAEHEGLKFSIAEVEKGFAGWTSTALGAYYRISTNGFLGYELAITTAGNVGIGTPLPTERLHVAGNVLLNATNPILQLQNDGVDKGFVQLSGDNLRLGTNSSNTAGKLVMRLSGNDHVFVENDGKMGVGQDNPQARLHINSGASVETMRLTGNTNTLIRFMTGATEKANIFASGNHLALSVAQPGGQVRLGNEIYVDEDLNRVGVGTTTPEERLHVAGNIKTNTGKVLNGDNVNMLPVAWAKIDSDGTVLVGTPNVSVGRSSINGHERFHLTVTGVDLRYAAISLTPGTWGTMSPMQASVIPQSDGKAHIEFLESSSSSYWIPFHLVVFAN